VLSRRLEDDQGRFVGVITAIIDLEDLKQFYGDVDLGGGSAIHLLREDGTLLVRNPPKPEAVGRKYPDLVAVPNAPAIRRVSPIDGKRDFIAVAAVRDTPLRLTITRDAAVALQPWRDEAVRLACARHHHATGC